MIEMRFHGRGGQGAVTSAELVAQAAIDAGSFATAFPSFGPERRGAPVVAFARVDSQPIRLRSKIYNPDVVIVLDSSLIEIANPAEGIRAGGIVIVNSAQDLQTIRKRLNYNGRIAIVDASSIARQVIGLPITNTTMVGSLLKGTNIFTVDELKEPFRRRFGKIAGRNIDAMKRAWEETAIFD
jgi:pyruvate ferredoxin oxidoreductase gamma subunit